MGKKRRRRQPRARIVVPKHAEVATPPGTLAPSPGRPSPRLHLITYGPEVLDEGPVATIAAAVERRGQAPVAWLNIEGVGDGETFKALGEAFDLHPLALEDVVNVHQRPKAEGYERYAYVVLQMPAGEEGLPLEQVSLFVGPDFVITVQERPGDCFEPVRQRLRQARGRIRRAGADYLAYAVIDAIIDNYFPVVEAINAHLDRIEGQIIQSPESESVSEIHAIRHDLHTLWRALVPSREAIGLLGRGGTGPIGEETRLFLRDCQDHTAQLLDAVEACRELGSSLMDLHLSGLSNRTNEAMKVLTLIATIFIPLGFIAGLYGMNFDRTASPWNMPELGWSLGYPFALGLMVATAVGFLIFFRRRGWLGRSPKRE